MPLNPTPDNEAVHISITSLLSLASSGKKLALRKGKIGALQQGSYLARLQGLGMEFDESRPYQAGDDIRHLDWRVTARTGKTYSKIFCEEQERPVFLVVDQRASMRFATRGKFKSVLAAEIASMLAWSAADHGDRIGSIIFSDQNHHEIKPKRGRRSVLQLINRLSIHNRGEQEDITSVAETEAISHAISRLHHLVKPRSLIFLISDFRCFDQIAESQLIKLSRHSNIVLILIYDVLEAELPPAGQYQLSNGKQRVTLDTHNTARTQNYSKRFTSHYSRLQNISLLCKTPFLTCKTTDDPADVLHKKLNTRAK